MSLSRRAGVADERARTKDRQFEAAMTISATGPRAERERDEYLYIIPVHARERDDEMIGLCCSGAADRDGSFEPYNRENSWVVYNEVWDE